MRGESSGSQLLKQGCPLPSGPCLLCGPLIASPGAPVFVQDSAKAFFHFSGLPPVSLLLLLLASPLQAPVASPFLREVTLAPHRVEPPFHRLRWG